MANKRDRTEYMRKYHKEHLKRVPLDISLSDYEELKAFADKLGLPVNTYIKRAIKTQMEIDCKK